MNKIKIFEQTYIPRNESSGRTIYIEDALNKWQRDNPLINIVSATPMGNKKLVVVYNKIN